MTNTQLQSRLKLSLSEIGLSQRTVNQLDNEGILFVEQLLARTPGSLLLIPYFGQKALDEVYERLAAIGFHREEPRNTITETRAMVNQ